MSVRLRMRCGAFVVICACGLGVICVRSIVVVSGVVGRSVVRDLCTVRDVLLCSFKQTAYAHAHNHRFPSASSSPPRRHPQIAHPPRSPRPPHPQHHPYSQAYSAPPAATGISSVSPHDVSTGATASYHSDTTALHWQKPGSSLTNRATLNPRIESSTLSLRER